MQFYNVNSLKYTHKYNGNKKSNVEYQGNKMGADQTEKSERIKYAESYETESNSSKHRCVLVLGDGRAMNNCACHIAERYCDSQRRPQSVELYRSVSALPFFSFVRNVCNIYLLSSKGEINGFCVLQIFS